MAAMLLGLSGCGVAHDAGDFLFGPSTPTPTAAATPTVSGFYGAVVADEPTAALVARQVLATGGNAADAAVALGFTLAVTYPSRAGLGGGGACLVYNPNVDGPDGGAPQAILFPPQAPPGPAQGSRPAALPMLARGLFALAAREGTQPVASLMAPATRLARFGTPVSRALADDLATVGPALLADPQAREVFGPTGVPLRAGANLVQPALAATLANMQVNGVGALYEGQLAARFAAAATQAGGPMSVAELRTALPRVEPPLVLDAGSDNVAFLPPPADGGLAAAAAYEVLARNPADLRGAADRAAAVTALWRRQGGNPMAVLRAPAPPATLPALPASTSFVVMDHTGEVVSCAVTMGNLFGTGRIAPGTGVVLAASPAAVPPPLLAAGLVWNTHIHALRAAVAASGQNAAGLAAGVALAAAVHGAPPTTEAPNPGRANVISCPGYVPGQPASCHWATDPRGAGVALGGHL